MRRRRKLAHAGPSKTNVTFQVPLDLLDPRAAPQEIGEWMVKKFFLVHTEDGWLKLNTLCVMRLGLEPALVFVKVSQIYIC